MSASRPSAFRSLGHYNYRLWAGGALISNIGTWVQGTAQDWLVLTVLTHRSAAALGIVMALQFAPQLLLLPWTGSAADYADRRKLLIATQTAMGAFALLLGLLTVTGAVQLWHVYVFAFLFGSAAAFDSPVRQTFVGELVGDKDLHNAVSLNSLSFNIANLIGPAVSGFLIALVGTGWAFVINGVSFMAMLAALLMLDERALQSAPRRQRTGGGFAAGLRYVAKRADLVAILIMLFLIGTFGLNFPIFISGMAVQVFHADARGYGLLSSIMAVGTIAGAFLSARRERPRFVTLLWSAGLLGIGFALAGFAPGYWSFAAALVVVGIAYLSFVTATNGLMQLSTEPAMRGRVMALRIGVGLGGTPVGAPIVGWVSDHLGPRWALGVGATSGFAAAAVAAYALMRRARPIESRRASSLDSEEFSPRD